MQVQIAKEYSNFIFVDQGQTTRNKLQFKINLALDAQIIKKLYML